MNTSISLTLDPPAKTRPAQPVAAPAPKASLGRRLGVLAYGSLVYGLFLATFLYVIAFVSGRFVPIHIDGGRAASLQEALLVNGGFLALFAIQHMIMARTAFKKRWTKIVSPVVERTTFVLATCAILIGMVWNWRAMPDVLWHVEGPAAVALWALSGLGWGIVLLSTFLIDHFELFGLRQSVSYALGRPHQGPKFVERSLYKLVRHPLMLGFLIAFWSAPTLTESRLVLAALATLYIAVGIRFEERDLVRSIGPAYARYRERVPAVLPRLLRSR